MLFKRESYCQFMPDLPSHGNFLEDGPDKFKPKPCPNGGLESNNLSGWNQYCGIFTDPINTMPACVDPTRANVVGVGTDPYGLFPTVYTGNYSLKLGNNLIGAQSDLVYFPITVTNANKDFKFRYAAVLEDPSDHRNEDKPSFSYWVTLGAKNYPATLSTPDMNLFNSTFNTITADRSNPFWTLNGNVVYRKWTCVNIDLSAYVGQVVSICFLVKDCRPTGHFGYAYIDGLCEADKLKASFTIPAYACNNGVPIIANGTGSFGEESHFWEMCESNISGFVGSVFASDWFVGQQAGSFNITNWLTSKNIKLKCNTYYRLKLAVNNTCTPWNETTKIFKYTCPYIYNEPDKNICCPAAPCYTLGQPPFTEEPGIPLPNISYYWTQSGVNGEIGVKPTVVVCPTVTTQYTLTITDQNGCKNSDVVNVYFRGPLSIEVLNQGTCCDRNYIANIIENPCSLVDGNSNYSNDIKWTQNNNGVIQTLSNSNSLIPSESGGVYTITASNICSTAIKTVSIEPVVTFFPNGVPAIAFDQMVFSYNPMPIYHYDVSGHPGNPIFWVGSPAYSSYNYRLEIYSRWNSTSFATSPANLIRVIQTSGCNKFSNGDIKIDGYDSHGTYVQNGQYLFKLYLIDCDGALRQVTQYYRRTLVCDEYQWQWLGHGYVVPTKVCIRSHWENQVLSSPGGIFNFFNN